MLTKRNILLPLISGLLLLSVACSNIDNPVGKSMRMDLKTETKWSVDLDTENKTNKIHL
jgi:hypothetical protein